jgi:hypothetical protein
LTDAAWFEQKQKCSFCRFFLESPCKLHFAKWSKCVDIAKSKDLDFVQACKTYTSALMECTSDNDKYFEENRPKHGDSGEDDDERNEKHVMTEEEAKQTQNNANNDDDDDDDDD